MCSEKEDSPLLISEEVLIGWKIKENDPAVVADFDLETVERGLAVVNAMAALPAGFQLDQRSPSQLSSLSLL